MRFLPKAISSKIPYRVPFKVPYKECLFAMVIGLSFGSHFIQAQETKPALSMDELLSTVKRGKALDSKDNAARLAAFQAQRSEQQTLLAALKAEEQELEKLSEQREAQFETNDQNITQLRVRLNERLGALKELFGVLQQVSSDAQGQFYNSLTTLQYPERAEYLSAFSEKMGQTTELPSIEEIEHLWFELQREMVESGKVIRRKQAVVGTDGEERERDVVRVGTFSLVADGQYLQFIPETGRVLEYVRQPSARYMEGATKITDTNLAVIPFSIDPTRGQLLSLLVAAPDLRDRIHQGGIIGYVTMFLGAIAILTAIYRLLHLTVIQRRVTQQIADPTRIGNNPLGRILDEYNSHKERDLETLELKLGEAVLREVPRINRGLSFLKLIAAVAPLLGLLGTVTGMIITFQSIVLFGAGDPKMMAGGISQALVTTVQGLTMAIPILLLHNLVQTRSKALTEILEQEAVAIVASQAEAQHQQSAVSS
jgi:biopolymer transport protein ExbB